MGGGGVVERWSWGRRQVEGFGGDVKENEHSSKYETAQPKFIDHFFFLFFHKREVLGTLYLKPNGYIRTILLSRAIPE